MILYRIQILTASKGAAILEPKATKLPRASNDVALLVVCARRACLHQYKELSHKVKPYMKMRILSLICLDSSKARYMPSVPKVPGSNPQSASS